MATPPPDDPGNPTVDFHGERRTNATHQGTTTAPEARLARKGAGKEATLCFSGYVLMENRHGLCVDVQITSATGTAERETALAMLRRQARRGIRPRTLGGGQGLSPTDVGAGAALATDSSPPGSGPRPSHPGPRWPHHADRGVRPEPTAPQAGGGSHRVGAKPWAACARPASEASRARSMRPIMTLAKILLALYYPTGTEKGFFDL